MKTLNFESANSLNINHTFFFTTEKNNMRIDYSSLTNIINAYNGDITICPTYSLNGEDVKMEGVKANSPALYVAIIDSVKEYFRRIEEEGISLTITEKEVVNILCDILNLANDREEAIVDVNEATDVFDFDDDTDGKLENIQALLMEYLPVFYDTTESAYTYYCEVMRLTTEVELADIQDAFHRLQGAMAFPKKMAKETVKQCVEIMASAEDKVQVARAVSESLKYSMDGIRDFAEPSRSAIESLILSLDTYVANPDQEIWNCMWEKPLRALRDNLFSTDKSVRDTINDVLKMLKLNL